MKSDPFSERTPPTWLESSLPPTAPAQVINKDEPQIVEPIEGHAEKKSWEELQSFISGDSDINRKNILRWIKNNPTELISNQLREVVNDLPYSMAKDFKRTFELLIYVSRLDTKLANQLRGDLEAAFLKDDAKHKKELASSIILIMDTCREANISAREINKYGLTVSLFNHISTNRPFNERLISAIEDRRWIEDADSRIIESIEALSGYSFDVDIILKNSIDQFVRKRLPIDEFEGIFDILDIGSFNEENEELHQYCFEKIRECFSYPTQRSIEKAIRLSYVIGLLDSKSSRENIGLNRFKQFLVSTTDFSEKGQVNIQDGFKMLFAYSGGARLVGDEALLLMQNRASVPGYELALDVLDIFRTCSELRGNQASWLMHPKLLIQALESAYLSSGNKWKEAKKEFVNLCKNLEPSKSIFLASFLSEINPLFLANLVNHIPWDGLRVNLLFGIVENLERGFENGNIPSADYMRSVSILLHECELRGVSFPAKRIAEISHKYLNILSQSDAPWSELEVSIYDVAFRLFSLSQRKGCVELDMVKVNSDKYLMLAFAASYQKDPSEIVINYAQKIPGLNSEEM